MTRTRRDDLVVLASARDDLNRALEDRNLAPIAEALGEFVLAALEDALEYVQAADESGVATEVALAQKEVQTSLTILTQLRTNNT